MIYNDFGNDCRLSHRYTLNHGVLLSEDKSDFLNWLMGCLFPRDEIKKIYVSESILGGCAHFIFDIIIDNQTDVFIFVTTKII